MGKSLKNSVSPDEICDDYGADTLRVYEMAMVPWTRHAPGPPRMLWAPNGSCNACGAWWWMRKPAM